MTIWSDDRNGVDIHALSGAYAVDALDEQERAGFEKHLTECEPCRLDVAELTEAAAHLGALSETEPPPGLRADVLAGISAIRPLPPATGDPSAPGTGRAGGTAAARRWRSLARGRLVLAAAVAVLAAATGITVWQPWADDSSRPPAQGVSLANRVIADPDARKVTVGFPSGAKATAFLSAREGRAALVTSDMPPAPDGKAYQLWLRDSAGDVRPAGLMPDEPTQTVLLEGDASDANWAGITVEPARGSVTPTGQLVAEFDFEENA